MATDTDHVTMARIRFRYNPKTLKYERVGVRIGALLFTLASYLVVGFLAFAGLLLIQNKFIHSDQEKALRQENQALQEHYDQLSYQLVASQQRLDQLKNQENELVSRIFESKSEPKSEASSNVNRDQILVASMDEYEKYSQELSSTSQNLLEHARQSNVFHSRKASVTKENLPKVTSLPTALPLAHFDISMMVSGFGNRINPFHKGTYHHDGVDLRAPRGTSVLSAGNGTVLVVRKSDLMAGFGNYVEIDHGQGLVTRYAHLDQVNVFQGEKIKKGDQLGTVGMSGGSTAPHLHYEVLLHGKNLNPVHYMVEGLAANAYAVMVELSKKENQSFD